MGDLDQGIATLVAAIISIVIGGFNIWMTLYQSKKKDFVSTITMLGKNIWRNSVRLLLIFVRLQLLKAMIA